jgi:hypothetical protein
VAQAEIAYRQLDANHAPAYNDALTSIARHINGETPDEVRAQLAPLGVTLDQPEIKLQLTRYHVAPTPLTPDNPTATGAPILLEYDTTNAPLYPRDGLIVSATAIYRHVDGEPHLSLVSGKDA